MEIILLVIAAIGPIYLYYDYDKEYERRKKAFDDFLNCRCARARRDFHREVREEQRKREQSSTDK